MKLDLHGYTVHNAWHVFTEHVSKCYDVGVKKTVIITGHGQISKELIAWVHNNPYTQTCERLDPNTGAYEVKIKKKKQYNVIEKQTHTVDLTKLLEKYNKNH